MKERKKEKPGVNRKEKKQRKKKANKNETIQ